MRLLLFWRFYGYLTSVVDIDNNTAFNLEAVQTPSPAKLKEQGKSLVDHYSQLILDRWDRLFILSTYLAVDGYFSKQTLIK